MSLPSSGSLRRRATVLAPVMMALALALAVALAALGCAPESNREQLASGEPDLEPMIARARASADALGSRLATALGEELERGKPATAIDVCAQVAPAAASEISGDGVRIRRVSLRVRNPANAPDPWEESHLRAFEESYEVGGEVPADVYEDDERRSELRYLRPILVGSGCLQCHGPEGQLDPEVREQLLRHYPKDRAIGYSVGDLRGAFSIRVSTHPLDP